MKYNYIVPNLLRSIKVIECIAKNGMTFAELRENLSIPNTTLFRILSTLLKENWVEKKSNKYSVGYRLIQVGMRSLSKMELRREAIPYLDLLSKQTGETSHLVVLSGEKGLIIDVCDGPKHIKISSRPGTFISVHCSATGKVLLAYTIGEKIESFFDDEKLEKRTPNTITDIDQLKKEMGKIVQQGYAVDDREYHEDVRCIAAPIRDAYGNVKAAIGITATSMSLKKEMIKVVALKVVEAANMISRNLGAQ